MSAQSRQDDTPHETRSKLVLYFTAGGQAVLEENGEGVWFSDDDDDFQQEFGSEFLDPDQDSREILNYLMDEEWLEEHEKDNVEIESDDDADGTGD